MISLVLLVADVGGEDSGKDSGSQDDRPPSEISGSSSEACAAAPTSNCIGGDATGMLSVVNAGTGLGPWTGYVCEVEVGPESIFLLSACIPGSSVVGRARVDLDLEDGDDGFILTVAQGENTDGMLSDAAGVTNMGKGVWELTDGTGALTSDPRGAGGTRAASIGCTTSGWWRAAHHLGPAPMFGQGVLLRQRQPGSPG